MTLSKPALESLKLTQIASNDGVGVRVSNSLWSGIRRGIMDYEIPSNSAKQLINQELIERGAGLQADRYFITDEGESVLEEYLDETQDHNHL
jgi:hypothetical protein